MRSIIEDYNAVVEAASKFTKSVAEGNSKYAKEHNVMDCSTSIFQQMLQLRNRNGFAKKDSQRLVRCSKLHTRRCRTLRTASDLKTQRISAVSSNNGLECRRQKYE